MRPFFPPPAAGSTQDSSKKVQIKTKLAIVSAKLPEECSTEGSRPGGRGEEDRQGAQVQEDLTTLPSRLLCPLPGSIMPANPEVQLWARRGWRDKNS